MNWFIETIGDWNCIFHIRNVVHFIIREKSFFFTIAILQIAKGIWIKVAVWMKFCSWIYWKREYNLTNELNLIAIIYAVAK